MPINPTQFVPTQDQLKAETSALQDQISSFRQREASLSSAEIQQYLGLLNQANQAVPGVQEERAQAFKNELLSLHRSGHTNISQDQAEQIAEDAAQRFVRERKTGEQSLTDFVIGKVKAIDPDANEQGIRDQISPLNGRLGEFLNAPGSVQGQMSDEIARVNALLSQKQKDESLAQKQAQREQLQQQQLTESQGLLGDALKALQGPAPAFSPELNQAVLKQLQDVISSHGETAIQNTRAQAALRGLTGSSIEASGVAQTEKNISDTLAQATLNFLLQSGQAGERNREFIASTLANQANVLLSAGQGTGALAAGTEISQQGIDLQRQNLQNQVAQFNKQFQEAQREFNTNLDFQRSQSEQDLQLLLRQLNKGSGANPFSSGLGFATTGATIGGLTAGPPGAGIGAGAGFLAGLGDFFSRR